MKLILINSISREPFCAFFTNNERIIFFAEGKDLNKKPDYLGLALFNLSNELKKKNLFLKDTDAISVMTGPGSFTSIRVGLSLAKGLAMAINKKIITITDFELLKERIDKPNRNDLLVLIPAKEPEFYSGVFKDNTLIQTECSNIEEILQKMP